MRMPLGRCYNIFFIALGNKIIWNYLPIRSQETVVKKQSLHTPLLLFSLSSLPTHITMPSLFTQSLLNSPGFDEEMKFQLHSSRLDFARFIYVLILCKLLPCLFCYMYFNISLPPHLSSHRTRPLHFSTLGCPEKMRCLR